MFFNFNKVTDPPDDELVNPSTALNDNWQEVNDKLAAFRAQPTTLVNPPKGTEAYYPVGTSESEHGRIAVWSGTSWVRSLNQNAGVSVWQTLTTRDPANPRSSMSPPVGKVDSFIRKVTLFGDIIYQNGTPWPNSLVEITNDDSIEPELRPIGDIAYYQGAASAASISDAMSGVLLWAAYEDLPTPHVAIYARFQGTAGPFGSFISLDGFSWWY